MSLLPLHNQALLTDLSPPPSPGLDIPHPFAIVNMHHLCCMRPLPGWAKPVPPIGIFARTWIESLHGKECGGEKGSIYYLLLATLFGAPFYFISIRSGAHRIFEHVVQDAVSCLRGVHLLLQKQL